MLEIISAFQDICINFQANKLFYNDDILIYDGTIRLDNRKYISNIPHKINIINGDFICTSTNISDFSNFPDKIYGNLILSNTRIKSLINFKTNVFGDFDISYSSLCYINNVASISHAMIILTKNKFKLICGNIRW